MGQGTAGCRKAAKRKLPFGAAASCMGDQLATHEDRAGGKETGAVLRNSPAPMQLLWGRKLFAI